MQNLVQNIGIGGQKIEGPLDSTRFDSVSDIINEVMVIIFPLALFILFIYLLWAGVDLARNLGNPETIKKAKARITNAVIGIILLAISYWIVEILTKIFF